MMSRHLCEAELVLLGAFWEAVAHQQDRAFEIALELAPKIRVHCTPDEPLELAASRAKTRRVNLENIAAELAGRGKGEM